MTLEIIKFLYESREDFIKLFNDYYSIASDTNYKTIHREGIPSIVARVAHIAKVFDHSNLKILSPKQMLQSLPIPIAQVKAGNTTENLLNESRKIIYSLYRAKEVSM